MACCWNDEQFFVRTLPLAHHDIVSLAFFFEERTHINVWKSRLDARKLPSGPWLTDLKKQVRRRADDTPIPSAGAPAKVTRRSRSARRAQARRARVRARPEGLLRHRHRGRYEAQPSAASPSSSVMPICSSSRRCFVAARSRARRPQGAPRPDAGRAEIARAAGVKRAEPFHFSARYHPTEDLHRAGFRAPGRGMA